MKLRVRARPRLRVMIKDRFVGLGYLLGLD